MHARPLSGRARRTRAAEAEAAEAAAAAAAAAADAARCEALSGLLAHAASRREPLGYDRHWARYWLLGAFTPKHPGAFLGFAACMLQHCAGLRARACTAGAVRAGLPRGARPPAPQRAGEVFVERRVPAAPPREDASAPPAPAAAAAAAAQDSDYDPDEELRIAADDSDAEAGGRGGRGGGAGAGAGATWGRYAGAPALDALIAWLNPAGAREGALRRELAKVRARLPAAAAPAAAAGAPAAPRLAEGAAGGTGAPPAAAPLEPSAAERRAAEAAARGEAAARVAADVAALEAGLALEARDAARSGTGRMQRWRQLAEAARTPQARPRRVQPWQVCSKEPALSCDLAVPAGRQDAMAALVALEAAVASECLKPAWRLWALPAPAPEAAGAGCLPGRVRCL